MTKYILLLLFTFTTQVYAIPLYEKLEGKNYPFSALNIFLKDTSNKKITDDHLKIMERLLSITGVEVLEDYNPKLLELYKKQKRGIIFLNIIPHFIISCWLVGYFNNICFVVYNINFSFCIHIHRS